MEMCSKKNKLQQIETEPVIKCLTFYFEINTAKIIVAYLRTTSIVICGGEDQDMNALNKTYIWSPLDFTNQFAQEESFLELPSLNEPHSRASIVAINKNEERTEFELMVLGGETLRGSDRKRLEYLTVNTLIDGQNKSKIENKENKETKVWKIEKFKDYMHVAQYSQGIYVPAVQNLYFRSGTNFYCWSFHKRDWIKLNSSYSSTLPAICLLKRNYFENTSSLAVSEEEEEEVKSEEEKNSNAYYIAYIGGTESTYTMYIDIFNTKTNEWKRYENFYLNVYRASGCAIEYNNEIYILGGQSINGPLNSVERFDTNEKKWFIVDSMKLPYFMRSFACVLMDNQWLIIMGGSVSATYRAITDHIFVMNMCLPILDRKWKLLPTRLPMKCSSLSATTL